jgi:hypothetical protein
VTRFGKKGKLSPCYVGPLQDNQEGTQVSYQVALPPDLMGMHNVFNVSMLRKYIADLDHVIEYEPLKI